MSDQYVEKHEQVFRIRGTRVALDSVIYQFQIGRSPEAIQDAFPGCRSARCPERSLTTRITRQNSTSQPTGFSGAECL
jgi:hypothetical protein